MNSKCNSPEAELWLSAGGTARLPFWQESNSFGEECYKMSSEIKALYYTEPYSYFKDCVFYFKEFEKGSDIDWIISSRTHEKGTEVEAEHQQ